MSVSRSLTAEQHLARVRKAIAIANRKTDAFDAAWDSLDALAALLARTDELTESVRVRDETIENARRERVTLRARTDELTRIAGFFASVARSGEAWSTTCDETFAALADSAQPPRTPL